MSKPNPRESRQSETWIAREDIEDAARGNDIERMRAILWLLVRDRKVRIV